MRLTTLFIAVFTLLLLPVIGESTEINTIERMQFLLGGGVTAEYQVTQGSVNALHAIGTRRLRLINVDGNSIKVNANGSIEIEWSDNLIHKLKLCKDNGWMPRIIIGHVAPIALSRLSQGGRRFGPTSWVLYDKYIEKFINYVIHDWGFIETEWEVGNEMNVAKFNWVAKGELDQLTDKKLFQSYMLLYSHISDVVSKLVVRNPDKRILLGGPAVAPNGFIVKNDSKNWLLRFASDIIRERLICDFISMHMYGNVSNGQDFDRLMLKVKAKLENIGFDGKVSISEWGADWHSNTSINFGPMGGAFAIDFLKHLADLSIHDAMFLALSEFPKQKWPVLFTSEGKETGSLKAMNEISNLKGHELHCQTSLMAASCIAVESSNDLSILVWNTNWNEVPISNGHYFFTDKFNLTVRKPILSQIEYTSVFLNGNKIKAPMDINVMAKSGDVRVLNIKLMHGDFAIVKVKK